MFIQYTKEGKGTLICSERTWELLMKEVLKDIEYNTDTSTHSLSPKDKGMIQSDTPKK